MTPVSLPSPRFLDPPRALGLPAPDDPAKIKAAARDFESMAIGELLKPMFDTVAAAPAPFGGGAGEAAWRPMLVQEMGKSIARAGGFGLARGVEAAMLRMRAEREERAP